MSDPKNESAGGTPPEGAPDASEAQTQATPAAEAGLAQHQAAAAAGQPTAVAPPAAAAATVPAGPRPAWYRRRWAVITGAVAAGVILFLSGMAVGSTFDGGDRGDFGRDFHGQAPGAQGYGQRGWSDGGQGMMPPMGQGYGHDRDGDGRHGDDWDQGRPHEAPSAAPSAAPSTAPQAYYQ